MRECVLHGGEQIGPPNGSQPVTDDDDGDEERNPKVVDTLERIPKITEVYAAKRQVEKNGGKKKTQEDLQRLFEFRRHQEAFDG
jgi:hypothetical protein